MHAPTGSKLQIGVVGAGIAGLSAAIALTRAGHNVVIYERSRLKNESGAAIVVSPNATLVLDTWGFDFDAAGAIDNCQMRRVRADTMEIEPREIFEDFEAKYGHRWVFLHRADLHKELRKLVSNPNMAGTMTAKVELGAEVLQIDPEKGTISLADGREVRKDLIVIADGANGKHIPTITGHEAPNTKTPLSIYRMLVPFDKIMADEKTRNVFEGERPGLTTFYKSEIGRPGFLLSTYLCRNGELLYCALMHPTKPSEQGIEDWHHPASVADVLDVIRDFHPTVQAICEKAPEVKVYNQAFRKPIEKFTRGKAVLIGDAAHLMLPTQTQGAAAAIEDAAALEILFSGDGCDDVEGRLQMFEKLRHPRATATQAMSNFMMPGGPKWFDEARKYYDGPLPPPGSKTFTQPFFDFFFPYDIFDESRKVLETCGEV